MRTLFRLREMHLLYRQLGTRWLPLLYRQQQLHGLLALSAEWASRDVPSLH